MNIVICRVVFGHVLVAKIEAFLEDVAFTALRMSIQRGCGFCDWPCSFASISSSFSSPSVK